MTDGGIDRVGDGQQVQCLGYAAVLGEGLPERVGCPSRPNMRRRSYARTLVCHQGAGHPQHVRLVALASSHCAARADVIVCTLLRT